MTRNARPDRREERPPGAADRAALLGVRQHRHPVQGVRPARGAAHGPGEDRRRGAGAQVHRGGAHRGGAHPVGHGGRLRRTGRVRGRPGRGHRHGQRQRVPGRRLHAGQRVPPGPADPPQGAGRVAGVRGHHGRHRLTGPQAVVRGRHQLPGPGLDRGPAGPAGRGAGRCLPAAVRQPAADPGVQAVRAGLLQHRRARLGHRLPALRAAGRAGQGVRGHRSTSTPGSTPTTT